MQLLKTEAGDGVPIQGLPVLGTTYSAAISTASGTFSTDFTSDAVRVVSTADCFYTQGTAPVTATVAKTFLPAGVVEYVAMTAGNKRLAFITTASPAGTFYATEVLQEHPPHYDGTKEVIPLALPTYPDNKDDLGFTDSVEPPVIEAPKQDMGMMNKDITPANIPTWCVPSSMFTATTWAMKTGNPVRIAIQNLEKGKDHSQAEAMINGKWTPLTEYWNGESMAVQPYQRHYPIEPYRYLGLSEWMAEQLPKQKVGE